MPLVYYAVEHRLEGNQAFSAYKWARVGSYIVDDNDAECRVKAITSADKWTEDFPDWAFRVIRVEETYYA